MKRSLFLFTFALPIFAGQSLSLVPGSTGFAPLPNMPATQAYRVEFQLIKDTSTSWTSNDRILVSNGGPGGLGVQILTPADLRIGDARDAGVQCDLTLSSADSNLLIRLQRDPLSLPPTFTCEMWSWDASSYQKVVRNIGTVNPWPYTGAVFGGSSTNVAIGFFKVFTTLVPVNSTPPVTAGVGDFVNYTFDGTLSDSSGNGNDITWTAGTPAYNATPNQVAVASARTYTSPSWSNQVSWRAGYPGQLDCGNSYSLTDAGSAVTCFWQLLSGPSTPTWSSHTSTTPTLTGLVFGDYQFQLTVADPGGQTASVILDVGAVATDNNGVVVNANPATDQIFGPMIAFGRNPWAAQDYSAYHAAQLRKPTLDKISPPPWVNNLNGTVTYTPWYPGTANQTTLCSAIPDGAATSITVCDITRLEGITYPAVLILQAALNGNMEEVIVDSAAGNVLHVPYHGRGFHNGQYAHVPNPQAWPIGTFVNVVSTTGTGTHFLTDFCPAGVGEEGQIVYQTGTVALTAGSQTLTGSGTAWDTFQLFDLYGAPFSIQGLRVRIQGTHGGGTPFVFFATISTINSGTSITMDQPWPADADSPLSGLSYAVLQGGRYLVRKYQRPDGSIGQQEAPVSGCLSDTLMYHNSSDTIVSALGACSPMPDCMAQTGENYSYSDYFWPSEFAINYYDEVLAHYAGYFRSGLNLFRDNARKVGDYWPSMPMMDEGFVNSAPRDTGLTGVVAAAVLDNVPGHDTSGNWRTIRNLANTAIGQVTSLDCHNYLREEAYQESWVALAAMFDPDSTQKAHWQSVLNDAYTADKSCLVNGDTFYGASGQGVKGTFTMTHGNPSVTGTGFDASLCPTVATGAIGPINPGDTNITGSGFTSAPAGKIIISALRNGGPYRFYSAFTYNSATSITLTTPFDGDAGSSYTYFIESDRLILDFTSYSAASTYNTDANTLYACKYVDSSHITLDRGWEGADGTYFANRDIAGNVGYGNNPFQVGIKALALRYASLGASGSTATKYAAMNQAVSNWILTDGFDPVTKGMYYLRGFYDCEPAGIWKVGCGYGPGGEVPARTLNAEGQNAMGVAYLANPTTANRNFGDQFYGGQWGCSGWGAYGSFPLPWSDGMCLGTTASDYDWHAKWIGFLLGIGMSHQWPAVRLGGVAAPSNRTVFVPFTLSTRPAAAKVRISVVQPSGATLSPAVCTASPCSITVDSRTGSHLYRLEYLNASDSVVATGDTLPLYVPR